MAIFWGDLRIMAITTCQRLSPVFIATWATVSSMFSFMVSKLLCVEDSERRRRREKLDHHLSRASQITLRPTIHTSWEDKLFSLLSRDRSSSKVFLGLKKSFFFFCLRMNGKYFLWRHQSFFLLSLYLHGRHKIVKSLIMVIL